MSRQWVENVGFAFSAGLRWLWREGASGFKLKAYIKIKKNFHFSWWFHLRDMGQTVDPNKELICGMSFVALIPSFPCFEHCPLPLRFQRAQMGFSTTYSIYFFLLAWLAMSSVKPSHLPNRRPLGVLLTKPLSPFSAETECGRRDDPDSDFFFFFCSFKYRCEVKPELGKEEKGEHFWRFYFYFFPEG